MKYRIDRDQILKLTVRQIDNLLGIDAYETNLLQEYFAPTLKRCEICFLKTNLKNYNRDGEAFFNPFHSVQYMIYLYYFANTISKSHPTNGSVCDKLYYLNKALNCLDLFYEVELPDYFTSEHPVGSVIGRAKIGEGFAFKQNCTVGGDGAIGQEIYPVIGKDVEMYANSMIIGKCDIGNNVSVGAGTIIKNDDIPDNMLVFGSSPNLILKQKKESYPPDENNTFFT